MTVSGETNGAVTNGTVANGNTTNGHAGHLRPRTPLRPGIYSPILTFFDADTEDLDILTIQQHAVNLAEAGLVGLVTMGSNGEAVHLSPTEKSAVTRAVRIALDEAGFADVPVIVGASEQSIRGSIAACEAAAAAGGEYALLVPPSYFRAAMDEAALKSYYLGVADASPLPIILYNYPGAVAGIDMDSDLLIHLAHHPNIVGTKFTCGNTGKLTRVALATDAVSARPRPPLKDSSSISSTASSSSGYMAFGGMADFTVQTAASDGSGIIAGGANVLPKTCVRVWNLWAKGRYDEAIALQRVLSKGDWVLTKAAVPGTKAALQAYYGYGGFPRRPLRRLTQEQTDAVAEGVREVMQVERSL